MKAEELGDSKILNAIFKPAGIMMGSKLRKWMMDPIETLQGADIQAGQTILEVGCGTGFFTIPAARLVGDEGSIVAMDVSSGFIEEVSKRVQDAELQNVRIVKKDALETGLDTASMDKVLLFGVIPFPLLPLDQLLPEMHRVLKPEGILAVWLWPPVVHSWVPPSIVKSGLFTYLNRPNDVYNYKRSET